MTCYKPTMKFFGISLFLIILSVPIISQSFIDNLLQFNTIPTFEIGKDTYDSTFADFNGDGNLDIASVNDVTNTPTLSIAFGKSNGTFNSPIVFPSDLIPHTIASGDLNHDGKPDLVVGAFFQNRIAVFLNQGNGQFFPPVISFPPDPPIPNAAEFIDLAIGDFNADGNQDVVAVQDQTTKRLRFFQFSGQGTLTVFTTLHPIGNQNSYQSELAIGDLNGDNITDVVYGAGGPLNPPIVGFVYGRSTGSLSFTLGFTVNDNPVGIDIKDLDNDGDKDLAVAFEDISTPTQHSLQVFKNIGNSSFTPVPKISLDYQFPPKDITVNDFNNDGNLDLAALISSAMVRVTYGRGDGTYTGETFYAVSAANSIISTDLNRDNKIDIAVISAQPSDYNVIGILFNHNSLEFQAPRAVLWSSSFIDVADFNNDNYTDLVTSEASNFVLSSSVNILINNRLDSFLPEQQFNSTTALTNMKAGDFNGDGQKDVITAHDGNSRVLAVYHGNPNGTLGTPVNTAFNRGFLNMIVGDFNSDGKDDIFAINDSAQGYSLLSNGNGTFTVAPNSPVTLSANSPFELQKGDFNNDNNIDLLISLNEMVTLWLGDGAGRFTQLSTTIPPLSLVVPGDFNNDGNLDLAGASGEGIMGVLGNGNGGFAGVFTRLTGGAVFSISNIVATDFDLDGFDDVALIMQNQRGNLLIIPSGGDTPSWKQPIFYNVATMTRRIIATDFNSDGKPDIGYLGATTRGVIYNTTVTPRQHSNFDYDGDGKTDISIFRPALGEWWYSRSSDGDNRALQFGTSSDKIVPADFTGDGKTDVAIWRPSSGEWFVLRSEDSSFYSFPFGTSGDTPIVGDFDADGKADAGVFRPSNLTWFISKSSGGTIIQQFGTADDKPVPADYDGDGKTDIAIFRANGANGAEWWIQRSSNNSVFAATFGNATDKAVQGDYTGDGKTDIAVWRPSNGNWFILRSEDFSFFAFPFGASGDVPVAGDYDGDGKFDAGVFRPTNQTWYVQRSTAGTLIQQFGIAGDLPTPNAFVP